MKKAVLLARNLDVVESNEAFAAQACAVTKLLDLDPTKVNPNGSGVSLGHRVGATGVIITTKAIYELHRTGGRHALVTMCIGGGQGIAAIFERTSTARAPIEHGSSTTRVRHHYRTADGSPAEKASQGRYRWRGCPLGCCEKPMSASLLEMRDHLREAHWAKHLTAEQLVRVESETEVTFGRGGKLNQDALRPLSVVSRPR